MPPRYAYWTIIVEGKPTAFRAQHRDDLLPTLRQLQTRHPDTVMMWFARGRLWGSPEEAQAASRGGTERRPGDWRPGGEHRDPRARFAISRDEKRRRFAARQRRDHRDAGDRRDSRAGGSGPLKGDRTSRGPQRARERRGGWREGSGPREGTSGRTRTPGERRDRPPPRGADRSKPDARQRSKPGGGKPGGGRGGRGGGGSGR